MFILLVIIFLGLRWIWQEATKKVNPGDLEKVRAQNEWAAMSPEQQKKHVEALSNSQAMKDFRESLRTGKLSDSMDPERKARIQAKIREYEARSISDKQHKRLEGD